MTRSRKSTSKTRSSARPAKRKSTTMKKAPTSRPAPVAPAKPAVANDGNNTINNVIPFRRFQPWNHHAPLQEGAARRGYARAVSPLRHSRGK